MGQLKSSNLALCLFFILTVFTSTAVLSQKKEAKELAAERKKLAELISKMPDSVFVDITGFTKLFGFQMKYATKDNFLKEQVYDCAKCLLRVESVKGLIKAEKLFRDQGYMISFFDCYRPLYIQKRMWEILPDSRYVANPTKTGSGSNHNRGAAIDMTITDLSGKELDMGTAFDHFGEEAHLAYTKLSEKVLENRKILKTTMEKAGFVPQNSEWWHFSLGTPKKYPLADVPVKCDQ
jgi:zinc D-Ala-D-Ala dipeptidase